MITKTKIALGDSVEAQSKTQLFWMSSELSFPNNPPVTACQPFWLTQPRVLWASKIKIIFGNQISCQ